MRINAFLTYSPLEITIRKDSLDIVARVPHARHGNETLLDIDVPLQEQSEGQHPNAQRNGSDRPNRKRPFPVTLFGPPGSLRSMMSKIIDIRPPRSRR
ncbi:hypothetical protein M405DRAFT_808262 [Rhizopogon salebrosus TDB-379]|nr:hypothetical protein M405DRAFT_808262 [Rhizopogon salebrosus TDB-379]